VRDLINELEIRLGSGGLDQKMKDVQVKSSSRAKNTCTSVYSHVSILRATIFLIHNHPCACVWERVCAPMCVFVCV